MFNKVSQLLTFRAFRPRVNDVKVPLGDRLAGQSVMGVVLGRRHLVCACIDFGKQGAFVRDLRNLVLSNEKEKTASIKDYAISNGLDKALVLTSPEFSAIKLDKVIDYHGDERLRFLSQVGIQSEVTFEPEKSYAYLTFSEAKQSLLFSYSKSGIQVATQLVEHAGLEVVRLTCGVYTTLAYLMSKPELTKDNPLVFIHGSNALFLGIMESGGFRQVGFRSNICFREFDEVLPKALERLEVNSKELLYVNCSDWHLNRFFENHYPEMRLKPIFEDGKAEWIKGACRG